jgi:histone H3/H4
VTHTAPIRPAARVLPGRARRPRQNPVPRAIEEIRKYQRSCDLLIPKAPFTQLVRDIAQSFMPGVRFQPEAIEALMESAESYLIRQFQKWNLTAIHRKRVTINLKDVKLVRDMDEIDGKGMAPVLPIYDSLETIALF